MSAALIWLTIGVVFPALGAQAHAFPSYYTSARLLLDGNFGPQVYDDHWFMMQVGEKTGTPIIEIFGPNPPTTSLVALPVAWFPYPDARRAWIWVSAGIYLLGLVWLVPACQPEGKARYHAGIGWAGFILGAAVLFHPSVENFTLAQVYIFLFFLQVLIFVGLKKSGDVLAGVALGLAIILKTNGAIFLLFLATRRRWKILAWSAGVAISAGICSLPWIGLSAWRAYPGMIFQTARDAKVSVTAYQSTFSFLSHLFRYDPVWNPAPLANWPALPGLAFTLVALISIGLTLWAGQGKPAYEVFPAWVPLNIVLMPICEEYHFIQALIPLIFMAIRFLQWPQTARQWTQTLGWLSAFALLGLPLPYEHPALSAGWLALLAYPRLYGAWLTWLLMLFCLRSAPTAPQSPSRFRLPGSHPP